MTEITDTNPSDMTHEELLAEWREAYERLLGPIEDDDEHNQLHTRRSKLWSEMESRVDVEPPECPDCESQSWSQEMGEPKVCGGCGLHLGPEHELLVSRIDTYWQSVKSGASA